MKLYNFFLYCNWWYIYFQVPQLLRGPLDAEPLATGHLQFASDYTASREHSGPVTPAGQGSSTGAAISCVSSAVKRVVAGRTRSCARDRSRPAASIRL